MKKLGLSIFCACAMLVGIGSALTSHATSTEEAFLWNPTTQQYDIPTTPANVLATCDGDNAPCGEIINNGVPTFYRED